MNAALTQMPLTTRWTVRPAAPPEAVKQLARDLCIPPILASILYARGFRDASTAWLQPPLALTPIPELNEAAARLEHALQSKRRILIHGDYDADGISGTAVLVLGLRALGGNVTPFIPNRLTDGYGVSPHRVKEHAARADLFITVDCGISNLEEVKRLQAKGVEVIVTDHHHPGQRTPDCLVVHPSLSPSAKKGLPELTGAGVAYHLLWALHERLGLEAPTDYSDLAAIGTIADVAPLLGENRALVNEGLARLRDSKWPGLRAVLARALNSGNPTARDVAFGIAPRLNAAGRLGEAELGLELLTTASERRAKELAAYLDARNNDRRKVQDEMLNEALEKVDPSAPALILDNLGWHPGVMGIVASKLLERFYKPVFIIAGGKGSVRSVPDISAVEGLHYAAETLERFGGHSQAAGFAIREGNIQAFKDKVLEYVASHPAPQPAIIADALLDPTQIDAELFAAISGLEPYGQGHPSPRFALTGSLELARGVGQSGKHLQLRIGGVKGISWNKGEHAATLSVNGSINAVASLRENEWQGRKSVEFVADEVRVATPLDFGAGNAEPLRIHKGTPNREVQRGRKDWQPGQEVPAHLFLRTLPLEQEDPLALLSPLETLVQSPSHLYFVLSEVELVRLSNFLPLFPTVLDLRRAFVGLQRQNCIPFGGKKGELCRVCLEELELLDDKGRVLAGQKRDPYSSETLLKGLTEHYKLQTFINAYRALDEGSFAQTVTTLFGSE